MSDALQRFHFEGQPIRGAHVCLDATLATMTAPHAYPPQVVRLLAELAAASSLLASTIRNEGTLTLQVRGHGAVSVAMAECRDGAGLRGIARIRDEHAAELTDLPAGDFGALLAGGDLAIPLQRPRGEPWQGIVSVDQGRLEWALEEYFRRSEQLETRLWLAGGPNLARGLLLQRLPLRDAEMHADFDEDAWVRVTTLAAAVGPGELSRLDCRELLMRLFGGERVRLTDHVPQQFRCTCSRERTAGALRIMGEQEVRQILSEDGEVRVECQFCKRAFTWDGGAVGQLFGPG